MAETVQRVAIAVVEHEGRFLVGTRRPQDVLAGHAEFPGGKCRPREESSACAVRECREETGLEVAAILRLYACRHAYAHGTLDLEFWLCRLVSENDLPAVAGQYRWMPRESLQSLPFPEANRPVIALLANQTPPAS